MSLPAGFPSSLDSLSNPTPTTNRDDAGFELDAVISRIQDILEALEAKVGIGASLPTSAGVLRRTAPGVTAWGQVAAGDITAQAIVNADVNNAAALAVSKLAAGGTANRVVVTADGSTMVMSTITTLMLAAGAATQIGSTSLASAAGNAASYTDAGAYITYTTTAPDVLVWASGTIVQSAGAAGVDAYIGVRDSVEGVDHELCSIYRDLTNGRGAWAGVYRFSGLAASLRQLALRYHTDGAKQVTLIGVNMALLEIRR